MASSANVRIYLIKLYQNKAAQISQNTHYKINWVQLGDEKSRISANDLLM